MILKLKLDTWLPSQTVIKDEENFFQCTYIRISLAGSINLRDEVDMEPVDETLPDLGSHPIAQHHPHGVLCVFWLRRRGMQITTYFADVLAQLGMK